MAPRPPRRVVIAGAGPAGLETLLALRHFAEERVDILVVSPEREYVYRPLLVAEPFGGEAAVFDIPELVGAQEASFKEDRLAGVERARRVARLASGEKVAYDDLVVACGGRPLAPLPGAVTFAAPHGEKEFVQVLQGLRGGAVHRVVFAIPPGPCWHLPLYELALLTAATIGRNGGVQLTVVTPEAEPLQQFGSVASRAVAELLEARGIALATGVHPIAVVPGALTTTFGGRIPADRVVAIPRLAGVPIAGLPHDNDGFVPTDEHGRVLGVDGIYAAGDAVSFPVKQGGIATQQADAVAAAIAAAAGAPIEPKPFRPVLRGLLLTGARPRFLRSELTGGHGETSTVALEPLWWPPAKIAGRFLGPYLAERAGHEYAAPGPEAGPIDVEVELSPPG
jgi:sulfide:quinone oxidoreductase